MFIDYHADELMIYITYIFTMYYQATMSFHFLTSPKLLHGILCEFLWIFPYQIC